jgi:2-keto-3-deoxy-L-rhamnonate aldolase RhmA
MANRLKTLIESGQPAIGSWISSTDPYAIEMTADLGFDWLLIDTEHTPLSRDSLRLILTAMRDSASVPVVRLSSNTLDHFQTALDLGAQGVVVPMINSRADARQAIQFCRYPPLGVRGFAPIRASRYLENLSEYISEANSAISLIVQIETPEAASNIEEILTTEGFNGIFIGPSDLASFMGFPAQTSHPKVIEAMDGIISRARAHSIPYGLPTWSEDECLSFVRKGGQLLTVGSDLHYLSTAAKKRLSGVRRLLKEQTGSA